MHMADVLYLDRTHRSLEDTDDQRSAYMYVTLWNADIMAKKNTP